MSRCNMVQWFVFFFNFCSEKHFSFISKARFRRATLSCNSSYLPCKAGIFKKYVKFSYFNGYFYKLWQIYAPKECKLHQKSDFMVSSIKIWDRFLLQPRKNVFGKVVTLSTFRQPSTFSNILSSEATGLIEAKFFIPPPWVGGMKIPSNGHGHMTKVAMAPCLYKKLW